MKKRCLALLLLMAMVITTLTGCSSDPKNFTVGNLTITLTKAFKQENQTASGYSVYLVSDDVIFAATETTISQIENSGYEIYSIKDWAGLYADKYGIGSNNLQISDGGNYYFVNKATNDGAEYTYVNYFVKATDSYWGCVFACKSKNYDKYKKKILKWADSIEISDSKTTSE